MAHSRYSLQYDCLYEEDSSHTGEISTQVACNAACVQKNAPVNMKEKYVSVQAIKRGIGYGCVSSSTKSPVDSYFCPCVCVMVALREVYKMCALDVCIRVCA